MRIAVRYYSKLGHTKTIAEAIAEGAGVAALSVETEPRLSEYTNLLFLGGAPYANTMDNRLSEYVDNLDASMVGKVILFTTSNWSRRTIYAIRKALKAKNIPFDMDYFYAQMLNIKGRKGAAKYFAMEKVRQP